MLRTRRFALAVCVVSCSFAAGCGSSAPPVGLNAPPQAKADDLKAMEGTWLYEQQVVGGKVMAEMGKSTIVIAGNTVTRHVYLPDGNPIQPLRSVIAIDPTTNPKQMDDTMEVVVKKSLRTGIYKLEGGKLFLCYDNTGATRPTEFDSPAGSSIVLSVMRRQE